MRIYSLIGRMVRPGLLVVFRVQNVFYKRARVRVAVFDEAGRLLLVKSWAGQNGWEFPGGGVDKGESWPEAARRELYEETGILVNIEDLAYVTTEKGRGGFDVPVFTVRTKTANLPQKQHNRREITHIGWHDPETLTGTVPFVVEILAKMAPLK
jgi:8-oxo-dGTP pyrophosphatase MutT (NUDIX family)